MGPECVQEFLNSNEDDCRAIYKWNTSYTNTNVPLRYTAGLHELQRITKNCQQVVNNPFSSSCRMFVDHCHLSGKFRKLVCQNCNDQLRLNRAVLPMVFHNNKNYDSHVVCIEGFSKMKGWLFIVIPQTTEKYIATNVCFEVGCRRIKNKPDRKILFNIHFLDSYQFLSASLESLVANTEHDKFIHVHKNMRDWASVAQWHISLFIVLQRT